jgi:sporulation protein YlmC with PRC-barrel domain
MFTLSRRWGKHLLRGNKGGKEENTVADDRMRELEERYEDYTVYDRDGDKIGKVDDLFVDETDREEYIGVRMGLFGLSGTTLIPMEMVRVNDRDRAIEVSESKEHVKDAPTYSDDDDVTGDFEDRIRSHFGLDSGASSTERGSYGRYSGVGAGGAAVGTTGVGDTTMRGDQTETARHSDRPMGGAQDKDVHDERERDPLGQEEYRNREDMGRESSMGAAGTGGSTAPGGISDLETTGEPGRATGRGDRDDADLGDMTRGHREGFGASTGRGGDLERGDLDRDRGGLDRERGGVGAGGMTGDRGDLGSSGGGMTGGDEGIRGRPEDEGYREGYREGVREGLRQAGVLGDRGDVGDRGVTEEEGYRGGEGRGGIDDREDLGTSGSIGRSEPTEEGMSRRDAGGPGGVGDEGMTGGGREAREGSERREGTGEQEESGLSRVWRRVRE